MKKSNNPEFQIEKEEGGEATKELFTAEGKDTSRGVGKPSQVLDF